LGFAAFLITAVVHLTTYLPASLHAVLLLFSVLAIPHFAVIPILWAFFVLSYSRNGRRLRNPTASNVFARWMEAIQQERHIREMAIALVPMSIRIASVLVFTYTAVSFVIFGVTVGNHEPTAVQSIRVATTFGMTFSILPASYFAWVAPGLARFLECQHSRITSKALTSRVFEPKFKALVQEARLKRDGG
jgi:hypothetical protein